MPSHLSLRLTSGPNISAGEASTEVGVDDHHEVLEVRVGVARVSAILYDSVPGTGVGRPVDDIIRNATGVPEVHADAGLGKLESVDTTIGLIERKTERGRRIKREATAGRRHAGIAIAITLYNQGCLN